MECALCGRQREETLTHFIKECCGLAHVNESCGVWEEETVEKILLFSNRDQGEVGRRRNLFRCCGGRCRGRLKDWTDGVLHCRRRSWNNTHKTQCRCKGNTGQVNCTVLQRLKDRETGCTWSVRRPEPNKVNPRKNQEKKKTVEGKKVQQSSNILLLKPSSPTPLSTL